MPVLPRSLQSRPANGTPNPFKPSAIGFDIFAGGFTLGVSKYFNVLCHLEETNYGNKTAAHNFPRLPIYIGEENWPIGKLSESKTPIVLQYGNPPCAAWSTAGYSKTRGPEKWMNDPRVTCTEKHFSLIEVLKPTFWVWESVVQAYTKGWDFVQSLTLRAAELGYSTSYVLHDARYLGLPQVRRRFFMVCHRIQFIPITPDFNKMVLPVDVLKTCKKPGTPCWGQGSTETRWTPEAISKIEPGERLSRHWERNYAKGPDKAKWERNPNGTIKGRPSFGHCRLPIDRPGGAVVGYGLIHPVENRFISTEEMQLLCGFPESFHFTPKGTSARASEIARGVCPTVGEWLAKGIYQSWTKNLPLPTPTVTYWDFRKPDIQPMDLTPILHEQQEFPPENDEAGISDEEVMEGS